jgi:hypothetical protein
MSFTKDQKIDLLNTLQLKGLTDYVSDWNKGGNVNDMREVLARELNNLNYHGPRNNYQTIKNYLDNAYPYGINYIVPSFSDA